MNDENNIPDEVVEMWLEHCYCCRLCGSAPCDGACAGGLCDEQCHCHNDDEDFSEGDE